VGIASILAAPHVHAAVVAAWDFLDTRGTPEAGWTEWITSDMTNGVANTVGGITIDVEYSGGSSNFFGGAKQINDAANFIAEDPALLMLTTNSAGQNVYEDYLGGLNLSKPVFTLSGLTPGNDYKVQFVGTFAINGKNISVSQDGAPAINIIEGTDSVANDIAYSRYFTFTATAGNTDVSFELNNINGNNTQQGVCGVIVDSEFAEESPVVTGFLGAGDDPASTTVTWTNLADTVTVSATGTADPTIDAPNTVFTKQNSTGSIIMDVQPLSEIGGDFNPTNWTGGTASGATIHATGSGWGVNDSNGNGNMQAGEALILTFDFSSLGLAPDHVVKLVGFNLAQSTAEIWRRTGASSGELVGSGALPALSIEVADGDEFALLNTGSTAMRLKGLSLDVDEVAATVSQPDGLTALAGDAVVVLDWNDDTTGFLDFYTVHRGTVSGTNTYDFTTNVVDSAYVDSGLVSGTDYFYAVTAVSTNSDESAFSAEVMATPFEASTNLVLIQHLDATNSASVSTNGLGEVTQWNDLSGNGNHAVDGEGDPVLWPSTSVSPTGLSGMDVRTNMASLNLFDSNETDAFLDFSGAAVSNNGFCMMVAFKADMVRPEFAHQVILGNSSDFDELTLRVGSDRALQAKLGPTIVTLPANVQDGEFVVIALNYKVNNGLMEFWDSNTDSVSTGTAAIYPNFSNAQPLSIGAAGSTTRMLDGMIGEVKIFSSYLSASDFETERLSLVEQWIGSGGYDAWAESYGLYGDDAAETNDVEPDGLNNLMEYAFGGNPTNADAALVKPMVSTLVDGGTNWFYHVHNERDDDQLTYTIELDNDLVNAPSWSTNGIEWVGQSDYVNEIRSVTNRTDVDDSEFIRLTVENQ